VQIFSLTGQNQNISSSKCRLITVLLTCISSIETTVTQYPVKDMVSMDTRPYSQDEPPMKIRYILLSFTLTSASAIADNSTLDAAIGGGIGGAAGAAIGNEIGGRDGAIIGGALGGAVGVAVNTDEKPQHSSSHRKTYHRSDHHQHEHHSSHFCPPGQDKKGRC
jgi:outer membrane lipoprotein SlyB